MKNVKIDIVGHEAIIRIDLRQEYGPSKSGKNIIVASTNGAINIPGNENIRLGLNCYKSAKSSYTKIHSNDNNNNSRNGYDVSLDAMERSYIFELLRKHNYNKSKVARILDISRSTLREKLKKYGMS